MLNRQGSSIRWHMVKTILFKELLDLVRDKITLAFIIGVPFIIYPASMLVGTEVASVTISQKAEAKSKVAMVGLQGAKEELLKESLTKVEQIEFVELKDQGQLAELYGKLAIEKEEKKKEKAKRPYEEYHAYIEELVRKREVDLIVMSKALKDAKGMLDNDHIWLLYDSTSPESKLAFERVQSEFKSLGQKRLFERLDKHALADDFITPMPLHAHSVASLQKEISNFIGIALPLVLILITIVNVFHPALSLTCSEKENGTLPTLLCTPVHHIEMILGKYLTLLMISVFSLIANTLGLMLGLALGPASVLLNMTPSFGMMALIFILLLPISMFYSALFLCFAILPRTYREGGNYLTPVILVSLFPACASLMPMLKLNHLLAMTPVCNVSLLLREILVGPVSAELIVLTIGSNLVWAFALLIAASAFFAREDILLGENLKFMDLFTLNRKAFPQPTPGMSIIAFLVLFSSFFYGGFMIQALAARMDFLQSIPWVKSSLPLLQTSLVQIFVVLFIPILICRYFHMGVRKTFHLCAPSSKALFGAVFLGLSMCLLGAWSSQILPPPKHVVELMEKTIFGNGEIPLVVLIISISIIPAVCEEIAFRGLIMRGFLKRLPPGWSIFLTAVLFAFMHFSLYRFLPTFVLGLVLGYAVWKTGSLLVGIVMHILNNGLVIIIHLNQEKLQSWGIESDSQFGWQISALMIAFTLLGLYLITTSERRSVPLSAGV